MKVVECQENQIEKDKWLQILTIKRKKMWWGWRK